MVSYNIKFWKLSILSWNCFYILPKSKNKINPTNHFSNVMTYSIWLHEKSWFRIFKMIFCSIKINTIYLIYLSYLNFKMWNWFQAIQCCIIKNGVPYLPLQKNWFWDNYRTCLIIPHQDFYKKRHNC